MKKKKIEIKSKSIPELEKAEIKLREEIARLRLELKVNPAKDTNIIMKKRKELAVILTIMSQKKEIKKLERK